MGSQPDRSGRCWPRGGARRWPARPQGRPAAARPLNMYRWASKCSAWDARLLGVASCVDVDCRPQEMPAREE